MVRDKKELLVIACTVIFIAAILFSFLRRSDRSARLLSCHNNLYIASGVMQSFYFDHNSKWGFEVSTNGGGSKEFVGEVAGAYKHWKIYEKYFAEDPKILACPYDSNKIASSWRVLKNENISYFINISGIDDASNVFVQAGDRNITNAYSDSVILSSESGFGWRKEMGLHGGVGNIMYISDVMVGVSTEELKSKFETNISGVFFGSNVIALP